MFFIERLKQDQRWCQSDEIYIYYLCWKFPRNYDHDNLQESCNCTHREASSETASDGTSSLRKFSVLCNSFSGPNSNAANRYLSYPTAPRPVGLLADMRDNWKSPEVSQINQKRCECINVSYRPPHWLFYDENFVGWTYHILWTQKQIKNSWVNGSLLASNHWNQTTFDWWAIIVNWE